jgi:hypothetical protein
MAGNPKIVPKISILKTFLALSFLNRRRYRRKKKMDGGKNIHQKVKE